MKAAEALAAPARAALLRCLDDDAPVQDGLDAAALLLLAGHHDASRAAYGAAFLVMGFSRGSLVVQSDIAVRTGLWRNAPPQVPAPASGLADPSRDPMEAAAAGLRRLMDRAADLPPLPSGVAGFAAAADWGDGGAPGAGQAQDGSACHAQRAAALCARLHEALQRPAGAPAQARLAVLLQELRRDVLDCLPPDARTQVGAPVPVLAGAVASVLLRRLLVRTWDLADAPFGSPGLLHLAAQVDTPGLGPYFQAVPRLVRGSRDLLALIQLAAGGQDRDALERWAVLLSAHMDGGALNDLAHELADLGLVRALWGLLNRAVRAAEGGPDVQPRRPPDIGLLWTLRDAGLDNGDLGLAVHAQRHVVRWSPGNATERLVLGEVEATAGQRQQAEASFLAATRPGPGPQDARDRLLALRAGDFEAFKVRAGYGTPRSRRLVRERRRAAERAAG